MSIRSARRAAARIGRLLLPALLSSKVVAMACEYDHLRRTWVSRYPKVRFPSLCHAASDTTVTCEGKGYFAMGVPDRVPLGRYLRRVAGHVRPSQTIRTYGDITM